MKAFDAAELDAVRACAMKLMIERGLESIDEWPRGKGIGFVAHEARSERLVFADVTATRDLDGFLLGADFGGELLQRSERAALSWARSCGVELGERGARLDGIAVELSNSPGLRVCYIENVIGLARVCA